MILELKLSGQKTINSHLKALEKLKSKPTIIKDTLLNGYRNLTIEFKDTYSLFYFGYLTKSIQVNDVTWKSFNTGNSVKQCTHQLKDVGGKYICLKKDCDFVAGIEYRKTQA